MTLATAYDSVSVGSLPIDGDCYFGYSNGLYTNLNAVSLRFPHKPVKSITVWGMDTLALMSDVCDCETGDYTPTLAAQWAGRKIVAGYGRPTIYCNTSTYDSVVSALLAVGLAFGPDVDWWEAHYDNVPVLSSNPGTIGKQYQSLPSYDVSVVDPVWLGVKPAPLASRTRSFLLLGV